MGLRELGGGLKFSSHVPRQQFLDPLSGSSAILVNTSRSQRSGSLPAEHLVDVHTVKRGNARKNSLNKEIDVSIRKAIGAKVATKSDGKAIKVPVLDSTIQSYTQFSS